MNDHTPNISAPNIDVPSQDTSYHSPGQSVAQPGARALPPPIYNSVRDPRRKSMFLCSFLSLMPGLGHIYVGYYQRGFVHFMIFGFSISLSSSGQMEALLPLIATFIPFFWFFNQIDALRRAALFNLTLDGVENMALPDEMSGPALGGSYVGGVALLVAGLIALSNTLFDLPLDWLDQWWPIAPIALGAYLVYREWQDQQRRGSEQSAAP